MGGGEGGGRKKRGRGGGAEGRRGGGAEGERGTLLATATDDAASSDGEYLIIL